MVLTEFQRKFVFPHFFLRVYLYSGAHQKRQASQRSILRTVNNHAKVVSVVPVTVISCSESV